MPVGFDVGEAAEGGDEAVELVEPAGALAVGGEVDGAAVDAGFDAPLGVGDEGGLLGDGAGVAAVEGEALADAEGGVLGEDLVEGGLPIALNGGGDDGLPLGALDELEEVEVVYLQPNESIDDRVISFRAVAEYLDTLDDPFSETFAKYVRRWIEPAALRPPASPGQQDEVAQGSETEALRSG